MGRDKASTTRWFVFGFLVAMTCAMAMGAADNRYPGAFGYSLTGPGTGFVTCVQHDTNELATVARQIRFNAGGTCKMVGVDGTTYTGTYTAGEVRNVQIKQIFDTGTSIADADIELLK